MEAQPKNFSYKKKRVQDKRSTKNLPSSFQVAKHSFSCLGHYDGENYFLYFEQ